MSAVLSPFSPLVLLANLVDFTYEAGISFKFKKKDHKKGKI